MCFTSLMKSQITFKLIFTLLIAVKLISSISSLEFIDPNWHLIFHIILNFILLIFLSLIIFKPSVILLFTIPLLIFSFLTGIFYLRADEKPYFVNKNGLSEIRVQKYEIEIIEKRLVKVTKFNDCFQWVTKADTLYLNENEWKRIKR